MTGPTRIHAIPGVPSLAAVLACAAGCAFLAAPARACDEEKKPAVSAADDGKSLVWVTDDEEAGNFWFDVGDDENVWVVGGDEGDFRWIEKGDDGHEGFTWTSKDDDGLTWTSEDGDGHEGLTWVSKDGDGNIFFRVGKSDDEKGTTYESWQRGGDDADDEDADDGACAGCCCACIVIRLDGNDLGGLIERLLSSRGDRLPKRFNRMLGSLPKGMNRLFGKGGIGMGGPGGLRIELDEDGAIRRHVMPKMGGGAGPLVKPRVRFSDGDAGEMIVDVEAEDMHFGPDGAGFGGEVIIKIDEGSGKPRIITKRFGSGGRGEAREDGDEKHEARFELKLEGEGGEGPKELFFGGDHVIDLYGGAGEKGTEGIVVIELDDGTGEPRIIERRFGAGAETRPEGPRRLRIRRGGEGEGSEMLFFDEGEDDDAPRPRVERERQRRRVVAPAPPAPPSPPAPPARAARPERPERPARPQPPQAPRVERRRVERAAPGGNAARAERELEARLERLGDRLERLERMLEKLMDKRENQRKDTVR